MNSLFIKFRKKLESTPTNFVRDVIHEIDWKNRFIGIKGARGVGKTTLLLQYAKLELPASSKVLYVSTLLDILICSANITTNADDRNYTPVKMPNTLRCRPRGRPNSV